MDVHASFEDEAARLKESCAPGVRLFILNAQEHSRAWAEVRAACVMHRQHGAPPTLVSTQLATLADHDYWLVYMREPARTQG